MSALRTVDRTRVDALREVICNGVSDRHLFVKAVLPELERLLHGGVVAIYELEAADNGVRLERFEHRGLALDASETLAGVIGLTPTRWGYFDPLAPEPSQRNRALTREQYIRISGGRTEPSAMRAWYARAGLAKFDQCRALLCEHSRLLAWVGGFRDTPFGSRERSLLQAVVPALRDCLVQRAQLADAALSAALLGAALENLGAPAFVLTPGGTVRHANQPGQVALTLTPGLRERLRAASRPGAVHSGLTLTRICEPGVPAYSLAILQGALSDPTPRVAQAAVRWKLTPREAMVLEYLAQGVSNKSIASALRCAPGTVEIHVTRLLDKAQVESRGALIARFWRQPPE